jgi:DoxX-like family
MSVEASRNPQSMLRTGWILSGIVIAFLAGDCVATFTGISSIRRATLEIGYPLDLLGVVGTLQLACLVLYAIPATSVLGAIIFTGLLGGAISSHLRVAQTLTPDMLVSLALGVLAWGGLWCRDPRLRVLAPRRR